MSWLGDHLSTIAGKVTDFTKDVLIDTTDHVSMEGRGDTGAAYSSGNLQQICKEKDTVISQLRAEKEVMQKSIVELDEQHQEALNQLLSLKLQLDKENKELKAQLTEKELLLQTTEHTECVNYCDNILTNIEQDDSLIYNLNFLTILSDFKNCHGDNTLVDIISKLEKVRHLIESKIPPEKSDHETLLLKINRYIKYFQVICDHVELLPLLKEIAVASSRFHSNIHENGPIGDHEGISNVNKNNKFCILKNVEKITNTSVQTDTTNVLPTTSLGTSLKTSCFTQTEIDHESLSRSLRSLDDSLLEISNLKEQIQYSENERCAKFQPLSSEIFVQTEYISQNSSYCQTKHEFQNDSYCQTEHRFQNESCSQTEYELNHSFSQTENDSFVNESSFYSANSHNIHDLQYENDKLTERVHDLKNELENLKSGYQQRKSKGIAISSQTTNLCKCAENEIVIEEKNNDIQQLRQRFSEIKEIESGLEQSLLVISDLEQDLNSKKLLITERDNIINCQKSEILKLNDAIFTLQNTVQQMRMKKSDHLENGEYQQNSNSMKQTELHLHSIDQLSMADSDNNVSLLQEKLKAMSLEKKQLLSVLNEKSQECSHLKAEVHKLTNIVASEKQALLKLQHDNQDLKQVHQSNLDPDLTREALQNLSRLVRDRDMEIEALKQKNNSITSVLKDSSTSNDQFQSLLEERDNLTKQIHKFKSDREKIMKSYNAKDQKCRSQQTEITELNAKLTTVTEKLESLEQQYATISKQYEEKQKFLICSQNEVIILKQKISNLENQQMNIAEKYGELLNTVQSNAIVSIPTEEWDQKLNELESLKTSLKDKHDLIHEKDGFIHELSNNVKSLKLSLEEMQKEIFHLKKNKENLTVELKDCESSLIKMTDEKVVLQQKLDDKCSELTLLRDMNERLNMTVKENEFAIKALEEKISSFTQVIHEKTTSVDVDQILSESKEMYSKAQRFHRERDETLLSLSQKQQENQELKNEIQKLKNIEDHLRNELDRLRKHLLQVEENYTNEVLKAEEREKALRDQLTEIERTAKLSSTAVMDASHQADIQVASLQEQVAMIAHQRDTALSQLSGLEDKVQQYSASLNNLQLVIEQMQKVHDQKLRDVENKWLAELNNAQQQYADLQKSLQVKQMQLEESTQALEAASRLSEILDMKEEVISGLKNEVTRLNNSIKSAAQELECIRNNTDGKVDRVVMKSLVLGYFSTPPTQKSEVVRLLARVLDFNQEEMQKAGIIVSRNSGNRDGGGLFSSIFGRLPSLKSPQASQSVSSEPSFSTLFVEFLENESQPRIPMPFPAEKMAQELTAKAQAKRSHDSKTLSGSPNKTALLLNIDAAFPTFATLPSVEYSSPTFLREVLE